MSAYLYDPTEMIRMAVTVRVRSHAKGADKNHLGLYASLYMSASGDNRVHLATVINYGLLTHEQEQALLIVLISEDNYFDLEVAAQVLGTEVETVRGFLEKLAAAVGYTGDIL